MQKNSAVGKEITLDEAIEISAEWIDKLSPFCTKISNAGTVRRLDRDFTNDIDIVLIRDPGKQKEFSDLLDSLEQIKGKSDGKWCMRKLDNGVILDVRMCEEDDWGWNLFRHTGPTAFHLFAVDELEGQDKDFKTENDIFNAIGIDYIEPNERGILDEHKENSKMNWIQNLKAKKQMGEVSVIQNAKHKEAEISIRGFIGESFFERGVTDKSIANALKEVGKVDTLFVRINSGGGSVFDAFSIFTQFRMFNAKIVTIIEGIAASAAAFISQAGDEREMSANALWMYHESSGGAFGNKGIMEKVRLILVKIDKILETTLKRTSNQTLTEIRKFMIDETFFTADEALEKGFIDRIIDDSDVEPHIKPKDSFDETEKILEEIYKRHAKNFEKDEHSLDNIYKLVENEMTPDKFSTAPYRPAGGFDKLSISNLPCVDEHGVVNINGLRYLKARLPLTVLKDDPDSKKREAIKTWIHLTENKFDAEKKLGKYCEDKLPSKILLEVDVVGKSQTFIQTIEEIEMNAFITNALGVTDESEVLGALAKINPEIKKLLNANVANVASPVATLESTLESSVPLATLQPQIGGPDAERLAKIETQVAQVLSQNTTLIAENHRLQKVKDIAMDKVEEVVQFKNTSLIGQRRKFIDELFYTKRKLNPAQYKKAIEDFVDIDPKEVPETESLYNLSIQLFETNEMNDKMEVLKGEDGHGVVAEDIEVKYEKAFDAVIKENDWNPDNENDLAMAVTALAEKDPKLCEAYNDAVTGSSEKQ